jgi:valyl-tRNA synthetase
MLYYRGTEPAEQIVIESLANVKLDVRSGVAPEITGAVRSTPDFDLLLQLPEVDHEGQRIRLMKDIVQLKKLIADKERQLSDENFQRSAPSHVWLSMNAKRNEYDLQLKKNEAALSDLK